MNMPYFIQPKPEGPDWQRFWLLLAAIFACLLFWFGAWKCARAEEVNLQIIAQIESSGNPLAYNAKSGARGLYQITPICLKDYNECHPASKIASDSLFKPVVARTVAKWYVGRIIEILARKGISAQISHILISYNWGVGNCIKWYRAGADYSKLPKETYNYIIKYNNMARAR